MKLFLAILCTLVLIENSYSQLHSTDLMEEHGIIPDVIDTVPRNPIEVEYEDGSYVNFGNELLPSQVQNEPLVRWESDVLSHYTLLMTDPDAPSRENPVNAEARHWLVGNIRGSDVHHGDVIFEYIGSGPRPDTGLHRYVFLIFRQHDLIEFEEIPEQRANTSTRALIEKYNLGQPIAGNFFQAQYEYQTTTPDEEETEATSPNP